MRGEPFYLIFRCLGIGAVVLIEIVLLRRQLQKFLLNGGNAVLPVEHLAEFFGEPRHLLVQLGLLLRFQNPRRHIGISARLCLQKVIFIGTASQESRQERKPLLLQFFRHIQGGGVVVGDNGHSLAVSDRIGDDIQNGLCLSGTGRSLDDADLGGKSVLHRCSLALIQAKGIDDCLGKRPYRRLLGRIQVAGENGCVTDAFNPLILGIQDIEAAFGHQTDRRCRFFEVFKNTRLFLVCEAVFLKFHLAFGVCKSCFPSSEEPIKGAKIQNLIDLRKRISVHGNNKLRGINSALYF